MIDGFHQMLNGTFLNVEMHMIRRLIFGLILVILKRGGLNE